MQKKQESEGDSKWGTSVKISPKASLSVSADAGSTGSVCIPLILCRRYATKFSNPLQFHLAADAPRTTRKWEERKAVNM
jgi:hypothetical protein